MGVSPKLWTYSTEHHRSWAREKPKKVFSPVRFEDFDLQPFHQSMKHGKWKRYGVYKDFPIRAFLARNVGRDYDEIFSELVAHIPKRLRHSSRIDEIWMLPKTYHPEGTKKHTFRRGRLGDLDFYVDLETKILHSEESTDFYKPLKKEVFELKMRHKTFVFQQLTTAEAFKEEGKAMSHCVSSYRRKCRDMEDETSIWSFGIRLGADTIERILTIQVSYGRICQVKGFRNRYPSKNERDMVREWAKTVGFTIYQYAFGWGV